MGRGGSQNLVAGTTAAVAGPYQLGCPHWYGSSPVPNYLAWGNETRPEALSSKEYTS